MGKPKTWQPKASHKGGKTTPPSTSTQGETPHFCFRYVDRGTKESWAFNPSPEDAQELLNFICEMAKLPWREIESQQTGGKDRHKKHHSQPITSIATAAQADLKKRKLDEVFGDELFRFRLGGEKRLWGFRVGRTFHVVFWDDGHNVCPPEKN